MIPASTAFATAEPAPLVAVVGGGPTGLLAAQRLAEAGYRVQVFEQKRDRGPQVFGGGSRWLQPEQ
jgi:flavin-dependent dehydrogenase